MHDSLKRGLPTASASPTALRTLFSHLVAAGRIAGEAESDFLRRHGLNPHQLAILRRLHQLPNQPQHSFELAEWTGVSRSGMTWLVDSLENKQLVNRSKDAGDRRAILISLTTQGWAAVAEIENQQRAWLREALSELGEEECQILVRLLQKAQNGLGGQTEVFPRSPA